MTDERLGQEVFLIEQRHILSNVNNLKAQLEIAIEENIFSISHVHFDITNNDDFAWRCELLDQFTIEELKIFIMIADVDIEKLTDFVRYFNCSKLYLCLGRGGSLDISIEELLSLPVKNLTFYGAETFKAAAPPTRPSHFLVELQLGMIMDEKVQTQLFENIPHIETLFLNVETLNVPEGACSRLKSLSVFDKSTSDTTTFHSSLLKSLSHLSTIESLFVHIGRVDYNGQFNDMMFVIALLPRLSKLRLIVPWRTYVPEEDRPSVSKILPLVSKLDEFILSVFQCMEPENQLESTVDWLSQLPCLRSLTLSVTHPVQLNRQIRALPIHGTFPSIEKAHFCAGATAIYENAIYRIVQCPSLSSLLMFDNGIIDLSYGIKAHLRELILFGSYRSSISAILNSIAHPNELVNLQLDSPATCATEDVNSVPKAIQRFEHLERLCVTFENETNGQCEQIVKHCLKHNFHLRSVILETTSNSTDASSVTRLVHIPQLNYLRLTYGTFTLLQTRTQFINALNMHPNLVFTSWRGAPENERNLLNSITQRNKCNVFRRYRSLLDRLLEINDSFLQRKRESRACSSSPQ